MLCVKKKKKKIVDNKKKKKNSDLTCHSENLCSVKSLYA